MALTISKIVSRKINFDTATTYPENLQVNLILDGTGHTYTVTAGGQTGTALATSLTTFINGLGGFTATNPTAGVCQVTRTSGVAPVVVVYLNFPDTNAYLPSAGLVSGAQVGRTVKNVTDGSTGTVTSNSGTSLAVGSLTGGTRNAFSPGDTIKVVASGNSFTFDKETWDVRAAGDLTTVPAPSFVGNKLRTVFMHQGRLGVTWGQSVVLTQAGKLTNWFRQSAAHLLPDDVIDLTSAHPKVVTFDSAKEWDGGLLLIGNDTQLKLSGQPALTPESVRLDLLSEYPVAPSVDPLVLGYPVLLARARGASTVYGHVQLYKKQYYTGTYEAQDLTKDLPTYITGNPVKLVGDPAIGFAALLTDGAPGSLFVYTFDIEQAASMFAQPQLQEQQSSWSRWDFPGATILGIDMLDGVIDLVVARTGGIFLETIDVLAPVVDKAYVDRETFGTPVPYTFQYTPSPFFLRNQKGDPEMRGWLTLHYLDIEYGTTKQIQVVVTPNNRAASTYLTDTTLKSAGSLHVPVGAKNDQVNIVITNVNNGPVSLTGFQWEGSFTSRSKRV